jgi:hypothetical protein
VFVGEWVSGVLTRVVVGGSGGRREWWSEGVVVEGSGGRREWWSEGVVVGGSGGRREWCSVKSGGRREWWSEGVVVGKEDLDAMYTRDITGDSFQRT